MRSRSRRRTDRTAASAPFTVLGHTSCGGGRKHRSNEARVPTTRRHQLKGPRVCAQPPPGLPRPGSRGPAVSAAGLGDPWSRGTGAGWKDGPAPGPAPAHLVVLYVLVGAMLQQHHGGLHVVDGRGPVQGRLACAGRAWKVGAGRAGAGPSPRPGRCRIPRSSTALTSAWELMRSSSMPSTASRAARISGVVPSCMRASRSVARFRISIWGTGKVSDSVKLWPGPLAQNQRLARTEPVLGPDGPSKLRRSRRGGAPWLLLEGPGQSAGHAARRPAPR